MPIHHSCKRYRPYHLPVLLPIILFFVCFPACAGKYQKAEHIDTLGVYFEDPLWDGVSIPLGQQCVLSGGNGSTPSLIVSNIPSSANILIFKYSDQDSIAMDEGGHGILGFHVPKNMDRITVPSVPGNTFDLPPGFFLIQPHRRQEPVLGLKGAYLPPCTNDSDHHFYVTVSAVYDPNPPKPAVKGPDKSKILKPDRRDTLAGKRDLACGKCNPPQECAVADVLEWNHRDIKDGGLVKDIVENDAKIDICKNIENAPHKKCSKMAVKAHYPEHLGVDPEGAYKHHTADKPKKAMLLAEAQLALGVYIPGLYE